MGRLFIFDSEATEDQGGDVIDHGLVTDEASAKASMPFRLGGMDEVTLFSLELVCKTDTVNVRFKIETWNDTPSLTSLPDVGARADGFLATAPVLGAGFATWNTLQTSELSPGGQVRHYNQVHQVQLTALVPVHVLDLAIRAYWARLRVWVAAASEGRLFIHALVGHHNNLQHLESTTGLSKPYDYSDLIG